MSIVRCGFVMLQILVLVVGMVGRIAGQDSLAVDEIVIIGTRYPIPVEKSGKSIYKLSEEDISRQAGVSISDLLNIVPGIQITGNFGTPGNNINYSSRGGKARQVVVLIDGVPVSDPSGIESFYDLRLLSTDMIASIEVLKGGLSTLYGSGASTAVINIKLKESAKKGLEGMVDLHGGSYGTLGGNLNLSGQSGKSTYMVSGAYEHSDGFSAASDANASVAFDDDGFDRLNSLIKYGYQFNKQWKVDIQGLYNKFDAEYDDGAFADADNLQSVDEFRLAVTPSYKYNGGVVLLRESYTKGSRSFESSFPIDYEFSNFQMDLSQEHRISNVVKGVWGVQLQKLEFSDNGTMEGEEPELTMLDPYASVIVDVSRGLNVHVGARLNTHSEYGSKFVYNVNPSWLVKMGASKLKLRASVSSSYITPSLFQLHAPFIGNTELTPESSLNWELGASLYANEFIEFNVGYFKRKEGNPIGFVSEFDEMGNYIGGMYVTLQSQRDVSGFESDLNWKINTRWSLATNYTYIASDNATSLRQLPKHKVNVGIEFIPASTSAIRLNYNYTGVRTALDFATFEEVALDAFGLLDVYYQRRISNNRVTVYTSLNNLLDANYVDVYGFTTRGRNWKLGVKVRLF